MFGYVREFAPELKVKELALYKAVYCGLCKCMGKTTGCISRLSLSYDVTFLAVVRLALEKTHYTIKEKRCLLHPLKKKPMMEQNSVLEYCASVSAILTYGKLSDDVSDKKGIMNAVSRVSRGVFKGAKKRAGLDDLSEKVSEHLKLLNECEKNRTASVDIPSDIFGNLTADILSYGLEGEIAVIARNIGFFTGKWIYAIDALDDMKDDYKSGSYNPFCIMYGESLPESNSEMIKGAFMHWLAQIEVSVDLIDFDDDSLKGIIYNILYYGMKNKFCEITDKMSVKRE